MFRSETKIDKAFWSVNRCTSRRESIFGAVDPQHVRVEAYHGEVDNGDIRNPSATLSSIKAEARMEMAITFTRERLPASESGTYGFSVRVVPTHACLMQMHELRLITWS